MMNTNLSLLVAWFRQDDSWFELFAESKTPVSANGKTSLYLFGSTAISVSLGCLQYIHTCKIGTQSRGSVLVSKAYSGVETHLNSPKLA